jgi:hypothetical protein
MRLAPILAACALAACQSTPVAAPEPASFYTLTDLTDEYANFFDRTQGMETPARVAAFKAEMNPYFPGFYDTERVSGFITAERYDGLIATSFENFPALRERYERTSATFESMIEPARVSFEAAFPDVEPIGQIYLLNSVGEMDGGQRTVNGRNYLVFGADVMARLYQPGQERAFFHHELFHVYHSQFFKDCDEVWCGVWREGLATYVAHQLNPNATDLELLLTSPRPIRPEVDADPPRAICAVRALLHSESNDDMGALLRGGRNLEGLPPRVGDYIGYLAAREAGRTRMPQQLAHLTVEEAGPIVEASLASLAECPSSSAPAPAN